MKGDYLPAREVIFLITSALRLKHATLVWAILYSIQIGAPLSQGAHGRREGRAFIVFFPSSLIRGNSTVCEWMDPRNPVHSSGGVAH
jgi:hypothetical protein